MITISLVIPMFNEAARIGKCLRAIRSYKTPHGVMIDRVIFVDDGSTDSTVTKVKRAQIPYAKTVLSYPVNRGKGHAVKTGILSATGDYVLVMDADMSTELTELIKFLPAMKLGADVIVGTRKNGHSTVIHHQPIHRELLGRGFTLLANLMLDTWVTDFTCGFKAFAKPAAQKIFSTVSINDWGYDAQSLFLAKRFGMTITEVPVVWSDTKGSKVRIFRDIPKSIYDLVTIRMKELVELKPYDHAIQPA